MAAGTSFVVAFVYMPWWGKIMYVMFMFGMVMCWTAADAMQIHKNLRVYLVRGSSHEPLGALLRFSLFQLAAPATPPGTAHTD